MEELKNEVLTEEIQEETTEIYEPDYEDIVPADDDEPKGSNSGLIGFVGGALLAGGIALGVKLWNKHQEKKKAKEDANGPFDADVEEMFEDDGVERAEVERTEVERAKVK